MTVEWFHILRLAQLVRRGVVTVTHTENRRAPFDTGLNGPPLRDRQGVSSASIAFAARGDLLEMLRDVDRQQEAEWAMTAFAEVAAGLSVQPYELPPVPCPACGADRDALCRPLHDGERDPGGWSHLSRIDWANSDRTKGGSFEEWRPHPQAREVATRVLAERRFSASGSRDLEILARTVLAYQRWTERGGQLMPPGASQAEQRENIRRYVEMGVMSVDDARRAMHDLTNPTVVVRSPPDPIPVSRRVAELDRTRSIARALLLDQNPDEATGAALDRIAAVAGVERRPMTELQNAETDVELRERVLARYRGAPQRLCNQETAELNPRGLPYLCRRSPGHRGPCAHDQRLLQRAAIGYLRELVRAPGRDVDDFQEAEIEAVAAAAIRRFGLRVELRRNAGHIAARVYPDGVSQAATEDFLL